MSLSDLAALGNFVSGVAVLATLLFLFLQMRQIARNQSAIVRQSRNDRFAASLLAQSQPAMAETIARVLRGDQDLTLGEIQSFISYAASLLWSFEDSYMQHRVGQLDDDAWASDEAALRGLMAIPGYRVAWLIELRTFGSGPYRDYVNALVKNTPAAGFWDLQNLWSAAFAEQMATTARTS